MKKIKCKVLAGNKGKPVNPYNEGYYQDPETGIKHYYDADYDIWQEFEDNNPILDLTTPCEEGQIVECGAEHVWQYTIANEWVTFPNTRKFIYADSFCEFSNFCSEARLAYQPLQNHSPERERHFADAYEPQPSDCDEEDIYDAVTQFRKDHPEEIIETVEQAAKERINWGISDINNPYSNGFIGGSKFGAQWQQSKSEQPHIEIYKWLLGYYDFPEPPESGRPKYYWRSHLREKLKEAGINIPNPSSDGFPVKN